MDLRAEAAARVHRRVLWRTGATLLGALLAGPVQGDEFDPLFSDPIFDEVEVLPIDNPQGPLRVSHELGLRTVFNSHSARSTALERTNLGLTSLLLSCRPSFEYEPSEAYSLSGILYLATDRVFAVRPDTNWSAAVVSTDQYQAQVRAQVAQYRVRSWQFKSGIQTQSLGLADLRSVADGLYAADLSVPGLDNLAEARVPAWTTSVTGSVAGLRVKLGGVHGHQLTRWPAQGSDFDTGLVSELDRGGLALTAQPLANMGWFGSDSGVVGALDWQLTAISQLAHNPVLEITFTSFRPPPEFLPIRLHYPRVTTLAAAFSYVLGNTVFKAELATNVGLQAQSQLKGQPAGMVYYRRRQGVLDFDLNGCGGGRLLGELQYGQSIDDSTLPLLRVDTDTDTDTDTLQWGLALWFFGPNQPKLLFLPKVCSVSATKTPSALPDVAAQLQLTVEATLAHYVTHLGSSNGLQRETSLDQLSDWIAGQALSTDQLQALIPVLIEGCQQDLGSLTGPAIFLRSFSVLALALVIEHDNDHDSLADGNLDAVVTIALRMIRDEQDLSGYQGPEQGWAHCLAHLGDLCYSLYSSPNLTVGQSDALLQVLADKVRHLGEGQFYYDEDERLANAVLAGVKAEHIDAAQFAGFLDRLCRAPTWQQLYFGPGDDEGFPWIGAYETRASAKRYRDIKNFLKTLYCQLLLRHDVQREQPFIDLLTARIKAVDNGFYALGD
ncbi:DUF2785 domain-containing protein [Reinekea sp.]|uniref:DUF2785 domain-containing protein n=1 Tax=Reinekea sp. TaxID=1970455 RepID=UPI002A7F2C8D|nr:DUF2785 domain-containing protein [Reinekea sp.]